MEIYRISKEILEYRKVWNGFLEDRLKGLKQSEREQLLKKNKQRPALAVSGYGSILFSRLLDKEVGMTAALVNSSAAFICGCIDDIIDEENLNLRKSREKIEEGKLFFQTGEGFRNLAPLREFIESSYPHKGWYGFLESINIHGDSVVYESEANSYYALLNSKKDIGRTYGVIVGNIIQNFSGREVSEQERTVLEYYSAGCMLLDDIADYYQDLAIGQKNRIIFSLQDSNLSLRKAIKREIKLTEDRTFRVSRETLRNIKPEKFKEYRELERLAKTFYFTTFFRKFLKYHSRTKANN